MNRFFLLIVSAIVLAGIGFSSCSSDEEENLIKSEKKEIVLSEGTRATAEELDDFYIRFTTDMTKYAAQSEGNNGNVIVSPLSAAMVLAMTANGVTPSQQGSFLEYLGVRSLQDLNSLSRILLDRLPKADNTAKLQLANSIWVNSGMGLSLTKDFSSTVGSIYNASIHNADFNKNASKTLDDINNWCNKMTGGQIPSHLDEIDANALALLVNALNFKAPWGEDIFDKSLTRSDIFYGADGETNVEMMESSFFYGTFANDDQFEKYAMELGNGAYYLMIVLPNKGMSVKESCELFTPERMSELKYATSSISLKLYMPKFSVAYKSKFNDMLMSTGRSGLCESLDFSMFNPSVSGSIKYLQSASFAIDESGAEAAAVTSGEMMYTSPGVKPDQVIAKIDSPFFFFIKEFSTGACILSGYISNLK